MKIKYGTGYNPLFATNELSIPEHVEFMELGVKQFLTWKKSPQLRKLDLSLHLARSPITEDQTTQQEYINYLQDLIDNCPDNNQSPLRSIGFHLTGSRNSGIGCFGFSSHFHPTADNIAAAIRFINTTQQQLGLPVWVENSNMYTTNLTEITKVWQAVATICAATNARLIIDLTHIYIDLHNAGINPCIVLGMVPWQHVAELHLSGFIRGANNVLHDGHSARIPDEIYDLYKLILPVVLSQSPEIIITVEHSDRVWLQQAPEFVADYTKVMAYANCAQQSFTSISAITEPDVIGYATSFVYKMLREKYQKIYDFMQAQSLNMYADVKEWLQSLKDNNQRLVFDMYELTTAERANSVELNNFVHYLAEKYEIRH